MNVFGCVHHLQAELVLIQSNALDLVPLRSYHRDGLILLRKFFGRFGEPPSQPLAGSANGLDQGFHRARRAYRGQIRAEAPSLAFHHMTRGAVGVTVKELLAVSSVADRLRRRLNLNASQIRNDLPNLIVGHADALTVGSVGGHHRAGNSLADVLKQIGVGVSVTLVGAGEVGAAATTACAEPVAESAVYAEFKFTRLRGFGVRCQWIVGFFSTS